MPSLYSTFFYATGEPLNLDDSVPAHLQQLLIKEATAWYANNELAEILLQELVIRGFLFRSLKIKWKKAGKIAIVYFYDAPVLMTRAAMHDRTNETINGAGKFDFKGNHFYSVVGKEWTSVINVGKPCEQHFIDTAWQSDYIYEKGLPALAEAFENSFPGLPRRIFAPPIPLSDKIKSLIGNLQKMDHSLPKNKPGFRALMRDYLNIVIDECLHDGHAKRVLKHNYKLVVAVRDFIVSNLKTQYTDEQLAKEFFTSEGKIKMLNKLTGLAPEQCRRHLLNHKQCVIKKVENATNAQLYKDADYADEPSFINGCITHLGTSPDNLKNNKWTPDKPMTEDKPAKRGKNIAKVLNDLVKW